MADVSVEFGAKDTGLENTLKTVQDELTRLDEKVKGGELSFKELQSTMKQVAQAEKLQSQLQGMAQATSEAGNAAGMAAPKVDQIGQETKKAGKEAEDFGEKSKGGFLKMSGAVAAGQLAAEAAMAGIRAAINLAKAAIDDFGAALDLGGRLDDLSIQTGIAAGELLVLERAFQNSGAGADKMSTTISKVASAIVDASNGSGTASAAFEKLGLSAQELINLPADQQFEKIASALTGVSNETERSALASDIFGERLAKDLLPLISDFSGEINKANGQLGSLPDIMNTSAQAFADIGDNIKVVQGKFVEFASGILSAMTPALEAITTGLSRIDAAGLGRKLAEAFIGGTQAMQGFQAAVDAFKIGEFGKAFKLIFESIKLQLMQTGNAIITNFTAAFKTAGDVMAEIFRADGPTFMAVRSAFDFLAGYAKEKIAGALSDMFAGMGPAFAQTTEALKIAAEAGASSAELALQRIPVAAGLAAEDIRNVLSNSTQTFKDNLAESESKFFDIAEQSAKAAALQDETTAAVARTNEEKGKGAPIDEKATAEAERQKTINAEIAAEKVKMEGLQNALNAAIASGNELEQQTIEKIIEGELAQERINKLTDQYIASGLGKEEAAQLAQNLVNSQIAADNVKKNVEGAKIELNNAGESAKTVQQVIDEINKTEMDAPVKGLKERTAEAREKLGDMKDFIGEDLSRMSLSSIIEKLGLDTPALTSSEDKLKTIEQFLTDLGNEDPADVTPAVDVPGSKDNINQIKQALEETKGTDATPAIDQEKFDQSVDQAKTKITDSFAAMEAPVTVKPEVDQVQLQEQIGNMQAEIENHFTGGEGGPGGQGGEGGQGGRGGDATADIESLVQLLSPWTQIISTIRDRLPLQALAY